MQLEVPQNGYPPFWMTILRRSWSIHRYNRGWINYSNSGSRTIGLVNRRLSVASASSSCASTRLCIIWCALQADAPTLTLDNVAAWSHTASTLLLMAVLLAEGNTDDQNTVNHHKGESQESAVLYRLMEQMARVTPLVLKHGIDDGSFTNLFHAGLFAGIQSRRAQVLTLLPIHSRQVYERVWTALISSIPVLSKQGAVDCADSCSSSLLDKDNFKQIPFTSLHRLNPQSSFGKPLPLLALTREMEIFEQRQLNSTSNDRIKPQFVFPFRASTHWHSNRLLEDGPLEPVTVWVTENNQNCHFSPGQLRLLRKFRFQWEKDHPNGCTPEDVEKSTQLPFEFETMSCCNGLSMASTRADLSDMQKPHQNKREVWQVAS